MIVFQVILTQNEREYRSTQLFIKEDLAAEYASKYKDILVRAGKLNKTDRVYRDIKGLLLNLPDVEELSNRQQIEIHST